MKKIFVDTMIFDLDGTLVDSRADLAEAMHVTLNAIGAPDLDDDTIISFVGYGLEHFVRQASGIDDPATIQKAAAIYGDYYRANCLKHTRPFPGVIETLTHFSDKTLVVLSNKPAEFTQTILVGLEMAEYFRFIFGGDSFLKHKPDPEPLRLIMEKIGTAPETTVMVGDGFHDIEAGEAAGVVTCGVTGGLCARELLAASKPDFLMESFGELKGIFF
ncbi:MAG: HAD-IA family hydrolase [Candidatus Omnitrophica bacterium]|nr:HAD-IA family hydrolase [Candidatus Omnitrophota bacterium]